MEERFTIRCDAGFKGEIWIIRASVRYRDGFPEESLLFYEGQAALLATIFTAGQEGRKLGATVMRAFKDDGRGQVVEDTQGLFARTVREMGMFGLSNRSGSHPK